MRQTLLATALVALFGAHVTPPRNFTPIPVVHGCRPSSDCLKRCANENDGDYTSCYDVCNPCRN
jgi:hypothetical protein